MVEKRNLNPTKGDNYSPILVNVETKSFRFLFLFFNLSFFNHNIAFLLLSLKDKILRYQKCSNLNLRNQDLMLNDILII